MAELVQVNTSITEEDAKMLDRMMVEDGFDNRSAFIRRLIRQEWARRYSQPSPLPINQAIDAGKAIQRRDVEAIQSDGGKQ